MRALACAKDGHAVARMEARLLDFKSELESQKERKQDTCGVFCIS